MARLIQLRKPRGKLALNKERIIAKNDSAPYSISILCKNGQSKTFQTHRLVALHFIPNPGNKPQVNHKNLNKHDNHVDNLEWMTQTENMKHAWANGRFCTGRYAHLNKNKK